MRFVVSIIFITPIVSFSAVSGQTSLPLEHGQQIRVTAPACGLLGHSGTFDGVESDTLVVVFGASTMRCSRNSVTMLRRYRTAGLDVVQSTIIGALVGGLGGAAIGAATYQECVPEGWFDCMLAPESVGLQTAFGAALGGIVGAGLGFVAAKLSRRVGWEEIPLEQIRVRANVGGETLAVGVLIRF